jgi:hypothetical protein
LWGIKNIGGVVNLRRGIAIVVTISALAVPACLLAAESPPAAPPSSPPDEATSNGVAGNSDSADLLKNKIASAESVASRVDDLCKKIPGYLNTIAQKKQKADNSDFKAKMSAVNSGCEKVKSVNFSSLKSEEEYQKTIKEYKKNFGSVSLNIAGAIKIIRGE